MLFNHGSGGADAAHTAGLTLSEAANRLAPCFVEHGYAFLYLQFVLLTTEHLDDVLSALAFLKGVPAIDPRRIAVAGHSFGG